MFGLISDYTDLIATQGVFALVVIFIFIVERRAIRDLNKAAEVERVAIGDLEDATNEAAREAYRELFKSNATQRDYLLRNHRSAVRVRNVLLVPAMLVWAYSIFFPPDRPKIIKMYDVSGGKYELQINPQDVDFDFYKRELGMGAVKWDVRPKSDKTRWRFTASHTPLTVSAVRDQKDDPPPQLGSSGNSVDKRLPKPLPSREVDLNVSANGPDEYRYRLDGDESAMQMGHLYAKDKAGDWTVKLPWVDERPSAPPVGRKQGLAIFDLLPVAFAGTSVCMSNGMPKDPEQVLNDLASRDLGIRLAARKALADSGASCSAFLEYAVNNTQPTLYRDRPLLVESLSAAVRQMKGVQIPDSVYAGLGKQNYDLGNYAEAVSLFGNLRDSFLKHEPDYLFYKGYAQGRRSQYKDAVAAMAQFADEDPKAADNTTVRASFGEALYQLAMQKQKSGDVTGACQEYKRAVQQFDLAIKRDPTLKDPTTKVGSFRSSARGHVRLLHCD